MTHSASLAITSVCVLVGLVQVSVSQRQLCGRVLADTLDLVCAGRGFHLGKRNGRSVGMVYGTNQNRPPVVASGENNRKLSAATIGSLGLDAKDTTKTKTANDDKAEVRGQFPGAITPAKRLANWKVLSNWLRNEARIDTSRSSGRHKRQARGHNIVDECCLQACSFSTLESYCAAPDDPEEMMSLNDLRVRLGFHLAERLTPRPNAQSDALTLNHPSAQINRGQSDDQSNSFFYLSLGQQATRSPLLQKRQSS